MLLEGNFKRSLLEGRQGSHHYDNDFYFIMVEPVIDPTVMEQNHLSRSPFPEVPLSLCPSRKSQRGQGCLLFSLVDLITLHL